MPNLPHEAQEHLLRWLELQGSPPPERRIFTNRALRLETIRAIGFDLDWTLAAYDRLRLERLTFDLTVERLVEGLGLPESVRRVEFRPDFPRRGLLIDREAATVLSMSRHRYVNCAYFGRERLDREKLKKLYRYEPIRPSSKRFYHLDSLFELPEATLFAELTELAKSDPEIPPAPGDRFELVREAIDWVHASGALKSRVLAEPALFLERDEELALALLRQALRGRRLFLLTNSEWSFVDGVCSHLFDGIVPGLESWRQLFDLVIVEARKPDFFSVPGTFTELDDAGEPLDERQMPDWEGVYRGGSLEGLQELLDMPGETVLYVGDHVYSDVLSPRLESTWRTALIVRELEEEIALRREHAQMLHEQTRRVERLSALGHHMDHLRDIVALRETIGPGGDDGDGGEVRHAFERAEQEHRVVLRTASQRAEEIAALFSPYWDSFFKQGASKNRFASQLETYACLYTSRVANFGFYGRDHYFRVSMDPMVHELELGY